LYLGGVKTRAGMMAMMTLILTTMLTMIATAPAKSVLRTN